MSEDKEFDEQDLGPSKSEMKRRAEHLKDLGKELIGLGPETLAKIDLPEAIVREIGVYRKTKSFGAQRRQLQLIGKYMRALDADAVRTAIDRATGNDKAAVAAHHRSEKLRDSMIAEDKALTAFFEQFPQADIQEVRQLVRNARKEAEAGKPPKSARALYKLIYSMVLPPLCLYDEEKGESEDEE